MEVKAHNIGVSGFFKRFCPKLPPVALTKKAIQFVKSPHKQHVVALKANASVTGVTGNTNDSFARDAHSAFPSLEVRLQLKLVVKHETRCKLQWNGTNVDVD